MNLTNFILADCYNFIKSAIDFFKFQFYKTIYHSPFIIKKAYSHCLITGHYQNITREIITGKKPKISSQNYVVHIHYKFNLVDYAIVYHKDNPVDFPPYPLNVFNKRSRPSIISIHVNNEDVTHLLKKYAGPKHNFYEDLVNFTGQDVSWILGKKIHTSAKITVFTSFGETKQLHSKNLR